MSTHRVVVVYVPVVVDAMFTPPPHAQHASSAVRSKFSKSSPVPQRPCAS